MTAMTADAWTVSDEFADNPAAESELQFQYLDRFRKVPVGPSVSLVFENANTLQFRVHEVQKLQRIYPPATVRRMLDWYASLLPAPDRLSAAVSVRRPGRRPSAGLNGLADTISEGQLTLHIGDIEVPGEVKPTRAGDRVLGPAFWVTFHFNDAARLALHEFSIAACVSIVADGYAWDSDLLTYDVRRSLCNDLERRI